MTRKKPPKVIYVNLDDTNVWLAFRHKWRALECSGRTLAYDLRKPKKAKRKKRQRK